MSAGPLLFNPSRTSLEELEGTLVSRHSLMEELERDLVSDARKRTKRHWQLIGPRGSGKSHLTELIARHLSRDHDWAIVRLPEEHYQIGNIGELLEQIVIRLEDTPTSPLTSVKSFLDLEDLALDRIRQWKERHRKPILVILENLGILFDRKLRDRRSQSRLREILSRDPPFILLATATSYLDATLQHSAPFYDFFQAITLEDLSSNDVAALVEARARWDMDEFLLTRIETVRSRAHAVFHFSGGNPRLVLALYSILRRGFSDELHAHVLKLLDEVTPYYQQRLNDIPPQMGRILAEMALSGESLTPSDIARRCRMPTNHVTANIAKLVAERFIRPTGRSEKRKRNYDLNDRLFRLWMQMREDRTAHQRLRFLSEFFQRWYEGHPAEVRHAASKVAEAFWQDLQDAATQRCHEHIATLQHLQDALPGHSELLLTKTLNDHRPPESSEVAEDQIRQLRPLSRSDNPVIKAISGLLLANALEYLDRSVEGLQILRDADSTELPAKIRLALLNIRLSTSARILGPAKAIAEGLELIERWPAMIGLDSTLAALAADINDFAGARRFIEEYVAWCPCEGCNVAAIRGLVQKIVSEGKLEALGRFVGLFEKYGKPAEFEVRALGILGAPGVPGAERFLQAVALWEKRSKIPHWLLWNATCAISHEPGLAPRAFPLIQSLVDRNVKIEGHTAYHLLLVLLDTSAAGSASFTAILDWVTKYVPGDLLGAAFIQWMPAVARTRSGESASILRVYRALQEHGALPPDLLPYSAAAEVSEAPEKMSALSPEVREAVALLIGTPEQTGSPKRAPSRRKQRPN